MSRVLFILFVVSLFAYDNNIINRAICFHSYSSDSSETSLFSQIFDTIPRDSLFYPLFILMLNPNDCQNCVAVFATFDSWLNDGNQQFVSYQNLVVITPPMRMKEQGYFFSQKFPYKFHKHFSISKNSFSFILQQHNINIPTSILFIIDKNYKPLFNKPVREIGSKTLSEISAIIKNSH